MSTKATRNFIGVYSEILENYSNNSFEMYNRLAILDEIAEKSLTFAEYNDYHKTTVKMVNFIKNA